MSPNQKNPTIWHSNASRTGERRLIWMSEMPDAEKIPLPQTEKEKEGPTNAQAKAEERMEGADAQLKKLQQEAKSGSGGKMESVKKEPEQTDKEKLLANATDYVFGILSTIPLEPEERFLLSGDNKKIKFISPHGARSFELRYIPEKVITMGKVAGNKQILHPASVDFCHETDGPTESFFRFYLDELTKKSPEPATKFRNAIVRYIIGGTLRGDQVVKPIRRRAEKAEKDDTLDSSGKEKDNTDPTKLYAAEKILALTKAVEAYNKDPRKKAHVLFSWNSNDGTYSMQVGNGGWKTGLSGDEARREVAALWNVIEPGTGEEKVKAKRADFALGAPRPAADLPTLNTPVNPILVEPKGPRNNERSPFKIPAWNEKEPTGPANLAPSPRLAQSSPRAPLIQSAPNRSWWPRFNFARSNYFTRFYNNFRSRRFWRR